MTAIERAKQIAALEKLRTTAATPLEEPERPTYPRVSELFVRSLVVEDECPLCGEVSGTDMGSYWSHKDEELPTGADFWCDACDHEWQRPFKMVPEFPSVWGWLKDGKDHWRAEGVRVCLTCWEHLDGVWEWEVWNMMRVSDAPLASGTASSQEDAQKAAEQWAAKDAAFREKARQLKEAADDSE